MREHNVAPDRVGIAQYNEDHWDYYLEAAKRARLLVFDNVLGSLGEGRVNEDDSARRLTSKLTKVQESGTTVVLVAHSAKNSEAQSGRYTPTGAMGSTVYSAWERMNVHVHDATEGNTRTISVRSNDHADRKLLLEVDWHRAPANWSLLNDTTEPRQRTEDTYQARRDLFAYVANDPELSRTKVQTKVGQILHSRDPERYKDAEAARQAFRKSITATNGEFIGGRWQS